MRRSASSLRTVAPNSGGATVGKRSFRALISGALGRRNHEKFNSLLGHYFFEAPPTPPTPPTPAAPGQPPILAPIFTYSGEAFSATCIVDSETGQFVVKQGSTARKQESPSLQPTYRNLRAQLKQNGVLTELDATSFVFSQDYAFTAITAAAQVVSGTTVNGRTAWRLLNTIQTFAEWQELELNNEGAA